MVDWSFNVFNSITVFSVASGFLCLGSQHLSTRTAFSFEAVLMLPAILAAFLSFFSSSFNSIFSFFPTFFFGCFFRYFGLFAHDRIVILFDATLSEK